MNDILFEACVASQTEWVDSFEDNREHIFSKAHEKRMEELFSRTRNKKYHKLTKNTVRFIIIAAILLALTIVTAFGIQMALERKTQRMNTETYYKAQSSDTHTVVESLTLGYIPEGYILSEKIDGEHFSARTYINDKNQTLIIYKTVLDGGTIFNTQLRPYEKIVYKNKTFYYSQNKHSKYLIWENDDFLYFISDERTKEEMLNISFSTK